jgi:hypothetical protein
MLAASIVFVIGMVSAWFICDSVLYERTDEARIEGEILPLGGRIRTHNQLAGVPNNAYATSGRMLAYKPNSGLNPAS